MSAPTKDRERLRNMPPAPDVDVDDLAPPPDADPTWAATSGADDEDRPPGRRIRDDHPLYKAINALGFTDGTTTRPIGFMNPERTRLFVKAKKETKAGEETRTRYYLDELATPCPKVEHTIHFSDEAATADQRVLFTITINGQTETVSSDDIQTMKAWAAWGMGPTRKISALLACAVFAQVTTYRSNFAIPQLAGEGSNGWRVALDGTHRYLTPGGQVIGAGGLLHEPSRMKVAVRPRSAYQYDAAAPAITQGQLDALLTFWRDVCTDEQTGVFLMGSVARMLANDLAHTPGGMILVGETATGKSALANLMRAAHATVWQNMPFMGTGSDRPGGLELAVTRLQSTVMVIDDGQGDGQDHHKTAKIVDALFRSYYGQEPMARRASSKLQATPDHVVQTAPVVIMEYLVPDQMPSALNRAALLDFGQTADQTVRIADVIRPRMRDAWAAMKAWGYGYLRWLAAAWDADPTLPDRIKEKERGIAAQIAALVPGEHAGDVARIIENFAGFIAGWWLIGQYAKAQGMALAYMPTGLIAWAAARAQAQATKINHSSMDVPGGLPFGEWACSIVRSALGNQHAHAADRETGTMPHIEGLDPSLLGWAVRRVGGEEYCTPQGPLWADVDRDQRGHIYLRPEMLLDALRTAGRIDHRHVPADESRVWARLVDDGIISRDGNGKSTHLTRIRGARPRRIIIPIALIWGTDASEATPPELDPGTLIDGTTSAPYAQSVREMFPDPIVDPTPATAAPAVAAPPAPAPISDEARAYLGIMGDVWGQVPYVRRAMIHYAACGSPKFPVPRKKHGAPDLVDGRDLVARLHLFIKSSDDEAHTLGETLIRQLGQIAAPTSTNGGAHHVA